MCYKWREGDNHAMWKTIVRYRSKCFISFQGIPSKKTFTLEVLGFVFSNGALSSRQECLLVGAHSSWRMSGTPLFVCNTRSQSFAKISMQHAQVGCKGHHCNLLDWLSQHRFPRGGIPIRLDYAGPCDRSFGRCPYHALVARIEGRTDPSLEMG